jgi:hypothetical protein
VVLVDVERARSIGLDLWVCWTELAADDFGLLGFYSDVAYVVSFPVRGFEAGRCSLVWNVGAMEM